MRDGASRLAGSVIPSLNVTHQAERAMTAPFAIHLVPVAGFTGVMAVAAFEDLRRLVIPNRLTLALCVLWPFYLAIAPNLGLASGGLAAGCAAAVFVVGALLFARGLIGGGDVKLLAVATTVGWSRRNPGASHLDRAPGRAVEPRPSNPAANGATGSGRR